MNGWLQIYIDSTPTNLEFRSTKLEGGGPNERGSFVFRDSSFELRDSGFSPRLPYRVSPFAVSPYRPLLAPALTLTLPYALVHHHPHRSSSFPAARAFRSSASGMGRAGSNGIERDRAGSNGIDREQSGTRRMRFEMREKRELRSENIENQPRSLRTATNHSPRFKIQVPRFLPQFIHPPRLGPVRCRSIPLDAAR